MENNLKIRSIEIEAFRGYNQRVLFDFTLPGGKLADFIAIYAPNGFGKTSFFDAVEWAIKGSIERFNDDTLMMQTASRQKGSIYKNIESTLEKGKVKIIDEENNYFERTTSLKSDQWDLLKGKTDNNSTSKIKLNYDLYESSRRVEILPQSRVDAFIASKKPSERYEALVDFWGGQDDSNYYRAVNDLVKFNDKILEQLELDIKKLQEGIIVLLIPNDQALFMEDLLIRLKEINVFDEKSIFWKQLSSLNDLNTITEEINEKIIQFEKDKYSYQQQADRLKELSETYPLFQENTLRKSSIDNEIKVIRVLLNSAQERILANDIVNTLKINLDVFNNGFRNVDYLLKNIDFFVKSLDLVKANNDTIKNITIENQNINNRLAGLEYDKVVSSQQIANLLSERWKNDNQRQNLINLNEQLIVTNDKLGKVESRLILARKISSVRNKFLVEAQREMAVIDNIVSLEDNDLLAIYLNNKDSISVEKMSDLENQLSFLNKRIQDQKELLNRTEKLNSNLSNIISLGYDLIKSTESSHCPLCKSVYSNFNELLNVIEVSKTDSSNLVIIQESIYSLDYQLNNILAQKSRLFQEYKDELKQSLKKLDQFVAHLRDKHQRSFDYITYFSMEREVVESNLKRLNQQVLSYGIDFNGIFSRIEELRLLVSSSDYSIDQSKKVLMLIDKNILDNNKALTNNMGKISEHTFNLYNLENDENFLKIKEVIKEMNIKENELSVSSLLEYKDKLELSIKDINTQINGRRLEIENYDIQLSGMNVGQLRLKMQEMEYDMSKISEQISDFNFKYNKIFASINFDLENIKYKQDELLGSLEMIDYKIDVLRLYKENVDFFKRDIEITTIRKNIQELKGKIAEHTLVKDKLVLTHSELSSFLKEKIDSVFNHEIINDIYQKIDPHPVFKSISLETLFVDKPELLIRVVDANNNIVVDPILYLSSAQVSILSLSIFFAKAIQNASPLVNTIFMDDPIQYMDSINILSFIDLIRSIISNDNINRQIVLSTHDENFFRLLKKKFDNKFYKSKFIEFESYGILKHA